MSSGGMSTPKRPQPDAARPAPTKGMATVRLPQIAGDLAPREQAVAGDVEDAGQAGADDEQHRADDVVLVHELEAGVEAEHRRHERAGAGPSKGA